MKNAPPPTKKSAQTNTRTTAKNGAAKNRATQLAVRKNNFTWGYLKPH